MNLWLSRQSNGLYMLSERRPLRRIVSGTDHEDLYVDPGDRYGDNVGARNICHRFACELFDGAGELRRLDSIEVVLHGAIKLGDSELVAAAETWFPTQPI